MGSHVNIRIRPSLGILRWLCRGGHEGLSLISWLEFTQQWSQLIEEHWSSHVTGPLPPQGVLSAAQALRLLLCVTLFLQCLWVHLCWQNPGVDFGDVSERLALRKRLQCRSFRWYLEHVYPEMRIYNNTITYGEVRQSSLFFSSCNYSTVWG